ncbi:heavy metal translocating P-type ATPase metal-binding domain-containing protein [Methylomicrobium sp. Wu6]|uniref:heavy metal translocating P-type ATPase metal-binding domain-containing protein n=1 Tax=Methylomicrobium sp. Wu6 TaxID=3107928 RepID=UPI002DD67CFD|nr:heavy metal translocating P-type ATPase metal-binding domain-containing protein [Methylomicrobium sp. Wu6]MEC4750083.1 heavy metal translocating P-type ATPase metal-binding domain-containing protein [Methylomicrobium sp. Wu6]
MSGIDKACDLCGLPVLTPGFKVRTKEGDKEFCCEGCMGIYQMLHEDVVLSVVDEADRND